MRKLGWFLFCSVISIGIGLAAGFLGKPLFSNWDFFFVLIWFLVCDTLFSLLIFKAGHPSAVIFLKLLGWMLLFDLGVGLGTGNWNMAAGMMLGHILARGISILAVGIKTVQVEDVVKDVVKTTEEKK